MPIDSHLPQADPFSLVPTFKPNLIWCDGTFKSKLSKTYSLNGALSTAVLVLAPWLVSSAYYFIFFSEASFFSNSHYF
jgi:hypothetical protein